MSPDGAIERILEVSAEAQIKRREAAEDSPRISQLDESDSSLWQGIGLLSKLKAVQTELSGFRYRETFQ
jgi:hypothetical protein